MGRATIEPTLNSQLQWRMTIIVVVIIHMVRFSSHLGEYNTSCLLPCILFLSEYILCFKVAEMTLYYGDPIHDASVVGSPTKDVFVWLEIMIAGDQCKGNT